MTHFLGMRHYILRHSVLSTYLKSRQQEESIVQKQGLLLESVMKVILTIVTPMCVFFFVTSNLYRLHQLFHTIH